MSEIKCIFCLNKTSSLKNKLTSDVLKDSGLFKFLCKYLLHQDDLDNWIRFDFDSIEEGMLPVCTKCANRYKELSDLYSAFQELETQIITVVEEFREFVFSSADLDDQQNTSDFQRNFRQNVLQAAGSSPDMMINIKEEVIVPDELEIENIMAMTMDSEYKIEEAAEENFDNMSEDNYEYEETQPDDLSFIQNNDGQIDQEEEKIKSESELIEPRRSLRNRDTPLPIKKKDPKPTTRPAKKRAKVTSAKRVKPELDSDSSMSSTDSDSSNSSKDSDYISVKSVKMKRKNNKTTTSIKNKEKVLRTKCKTKVTKVRQPEKRRKDPKKYICSFETCGMEVKSSKILSRHVKKHEFTTPEADKTLTCPVCQKLFAVQRNLKRHISLHQLQEDKNNEAFICQQCDICCKNQELLDKHISEVHQKGVVKFVCTICGNKFKSQHGFDVHLKAHAGIKLTETFRCKHCSEVFPAYNQLKKHEFLIHPDKATVYPCTFCGNKYYLKRRLENHLLSHSKEKTHECKLCPEKFKTERGLDAHNIRNHGKEPYTCTPCEKKFSSKSGFNTHNRLHHDKSKNWYIYECTMCDKKFPAKSDLENHMFYHGNARDFICEVCGKGFKTQDTLRNHMNGHKDDSEKPYKCDICNRAFSWYPSHKSHMKSHHGIDTGPAKRNPKLPPPAAKKSKSRPNSATTVAEHSASSSAFIPANQFVPNLPVEFPNLYSNPYPFLGPN